MILLKMEKTFPQCKTWLSVKSQKKMTCLSLLTKEMQIQALPSVKTKCLLHGRGVSSKKGHKKHQKRGPQNKLPLMRKWNQNRRFKCSRCSQTKSFYELFVLG